MKTTLDGNALATQLRERGFALSGVSVSSATPAGESLYEVDIQAKNPHPDLATAESILQVEGVENVVPIPDAEP